jgi:hypothetical protein
VNYIPPLEYQVEELLSSVILFHAQLVWSFSVPLDVVPLRLPHLLMVEELVVTSHRDFEIFVLVVQAEVIVLV